jgi:hypothetical protein
LVLIEYPSTAQVDPDPGRPRGASADAANDALPKRETDCGSNLSPNYLILFNLFKLLRQSLLNILWLCAPMGEHSACVRGVHRREALLGGLRASAVGTGTGLGTAGAA